MPRAQSIEHKRVVTLIPLNRPHQHCEAAAFNYSLSLVIGKTMLKLEDVEGLNEPPYFSSTLKLMASAYSLKEP